MRDIAALLFGTELFGTDSAGPRGARGPREGREGREGRDARQGRGPRRAREACVPGPGDTRGWDRPPVPTGDWCQTSPGEGTLEWLGLTFGPRGRTRRG
jgi:hypothetical protein